MADKYTKKASEAAPVPDWKSVTVEKEHQPAKQTSLVTYAQLESQVSNIDAQIASLGEQKAAVEAEMAKVKAAVDK